MLTLHNISKFYGKRCILSNVNATFESASITLFVGANGSGKSTLFKIIAGLTKPSSGSIEGLSKVKSLSYVAHATFLYPNLSAYENLAFWNACLRLHYSDDDIYTILDSVGLGQFADAYPRTFSRGMCQRLNLARAFMMKPDLLLLDEPMTGLDSASQTMVREKLSAFRDQGACILLISHDTEERVLANALYTIEDTALRKCEVSLCG